MNNKRIIAIDPGQAGGITVRISDTIAECFKMPQTTRDLADAIESIVADAQNEQDTLVCYMEKVGSMPHDGHAAAFAFGKGVGHLEQVLADNRIRTIEIPPGTWMKALSLGSARQYGTKTEWKNHLKATAQRLFPDIKVTLWNADSLLISEYATKKEH